MLPFRPCPEFVSTQQAAGEIMALCASPGLIEEAQLKNPECVNAGLFHAKRSMNKTSFGLNTQSSAYGKALMAAGCALRGQPPFPGSTAADAVGSDRVRRR
jgi:hypothetical protein